MNTQRPVSLTTEAHRASGKRFTIAFVSWILTLPGILLLVMSAGSVLVAGDSHTMSIVSLFSIFVFTALAVMTLRWLQDRRCHLLWPLGGTIVGAPLAIVSAPMFVYLPAVPLAIYLVYWHLKPIRN